MAGVLQVDGSVLAAAAVAASTNLVATLPESLLVAQGKRLGLVAVRGPVPKHGVAISLCWHERTHSDAASAAVRELVKGVLSAAGAR